MSAVLVAVGVALSVAMPSAASAEAAAPGLGGPAIGQCEPQVEGAVDQLPDMRMAPLYDLVVRTTANGRKRLRFGTKSWNVGAGPIEVRGEQRTDDAMGVVAQRVYDDQGGCRDVVQPLATLWYAGDGHIHWHVSRYMITQLYVNTDGSDVLRVRKSGFCLLDLHRRSPELPNMPADRVYWAGSCGTADSQSLVMGISVGYADDYGPLIAQQWIDVTGLPRAVYRLCTGVNPLGWWLEKDSVGTNNFYWVDVRLNAALNRVAVLAHGRGACLRPE